MNKYLIPSAVGLVLLGSAGAYAALRSSSGDAVKKDGAPKMMKDAVVPAAVPAVDEAAAMHGGMKSDDGSMQKQDLGGVKKDGGAAYLKFSTEDAARKLAADDGRDVVYFFSASWCPDCQAIAAKLNAPEELARLGKNTVIVQADYDKESTLKRRYGIAHQTTFVRIDRDGNALKTALVPDFDSLRTF